MTELELYQLLTDPLVVRAARQNPPLRLNNDNFEDALATWVACQIVAWLNTWPGRQHVMPRRVWYFFEDTHRKADIDLTVGHDGITEQFKVRVLGYSALNIRLQIIRWVNGAVVWNAMGFRLVEGPLYSIQTIPTGRGTAVDVPHF